MNQTLATFIKDYRMIKFYSEMMKSKENLQLFTLREGIKMLASMEKLHKEEMKDENV